MVTAINHAQLRLGRDFKQEEFDSGAVGQLMIDEDFNFEKAVSSFLHELEFVLSLGLISNELKSAFKFVNIILYIFLQKIALSTDRRKQFQNELDTLSGALKAKYDEINKEYQGIYLSQFLYK